MAIEPGKNRENKKRVLPVIYQLSRCGEKNEITMSPMLFVVNRNYY